MKRIWILIFILFNDLSYAETVILNNGKVLEGTIIKRTNDSIKLDLGRDIKLTYYFDEIKSIDGKLAPSKTEEPVETSVKDLVKQEAVLAIIAGTGDRLPGPHLLAKIEVGLSEGKVRLVERAQIDQALGEQALSLSGAVDPSNAIQIGGLLGADLILFFEKVPESQLSLFRVRIVESKTGIIVQSLLIEEEAVLQDIAPIKEAINKSLEIINVAIEQRKYLGVMGIQSEEPGGSLDNAAQAMTMLLESDLSNSANTILLDREHVEHLVREKELTNMELKLKASTYLVEGGIRRDPAKVNWLITLKTKSLANGDLKEISLAIPAGDYTSARAKIEEEIIKFFKASSSPTKPEPSSIIKEAQLFLDKVPMLISSGDFNEAIRHAEVANALNENQETHRSAALAAYVNGWKLADNFNAFYWGIDSSLAELTTVEASKRHKHIPGVKRTTAVSKDVYRGGGTIQNNTRPTYNSGNKEENLLYKPDVQNLNPSSVYNPLPQIYETGLSNETKQEALNILVRAYQHVYALLRLYQQENISTACYDFKFPDPLRYQVKLTLVQYHRNDGKALAEVYDHNDRILNLYHQLLKEMDEVLAFRIKNSFRCYNASKAVQESYWNDWRDRKDIVSLYYNNSRPFLAAFYNELAASINSLPEINTDMGLRGLWDVFSPTQEDHLNDEEAKVLKQLTKHKNLSIQLMAHYYLMRGLDASQARQAAKIWEQLKTEKFYQKETQISSAVEHAVAGVPKEKGLMSLINQFIAPQTVNQQVGRNTLRISRATDDNQKNNLAGQSPQNWDQFTVSGTGIRIAETANSDAIDNLYTQGFRPTKDVFIDHQTLYAVGKEVYPRYQFKDTQWKKYLYAYDLFDQRRRLFELPTKSLVTTLTTDEQNIYVGTTQGMIQYLKSDGRLMTEEEEKKGGLLNDVSTGKQFNVNNGFVDNQVLSMVYYDGKIYVGTGPVKPESIGYMHRAAFSIFDPVKNTYTLLASNRSVSNRNGLDGGLSYRILDMLADKDQNCIWLAVAGDEERNGIWKYDIKSGMISQAVKEKRDVKKLYKDGNDILYLLNFSGWVRFNPTNGNRQWLIGYEQNLEVDEGPFAPDDYSGEPLYGYPKTVLWPFGNFKEALFTVDTKLKILQLYKEGKTITMPDDIVNALNFKYVKCLLSHPNGVYAINYYGDVYLIK